MPLPRRAPDARVSLPSLPLSLAWSRATKSRMLSGVALPSLASSPSPSELWAAWSSTKGFRTGARARGTGAGLASLAPPLAGAGLAPRGPASSSSRPSPPPPSLSS